MPTGEQGLLDFLAGAVGGLSFNAALKAFLETGLRAGAAYEKNKKEMETERAKLLNDILVVMSPDKTVNLRRRLHEAALACEEVDLARLLCRIQTDANGSRIAALEPLEKLSDEEFRQMLYLLDDDLFMQRFQKIVHNCGRIQRKEFEMLEQLIEKAAAFARRDGARLQHVPSKVAHATKRFDDRLGPLADFLEGLL